MAAASLEQRLANLHRMQNSDGGWGYFAGKRSWLEPTVYSLLALHKEMESPEWNKGWNLLRSWQRGDGSWKPSEHVEESHWSTALAITLHCVKGCYDGAFQRGVDWLVEQKGDESTIWKRFLGHIVGSPVGHDQKLAGWPWLPGTNAWIEPTSHALIALKKAAPEVKSEVLRRRIALAEGMILGRRCSDGGWNYGSIQALGVQLPSYPETTALALLSLQGCRDIDLRPDMERARQMRSATSSRLAKAWLSVSLLNLGMAVENNQSENPDTRDVLVTALEALATPGGGHALLRPGARA